MKNKLYYLLNTVVVIVALLLMVRIIYPAFWLIFYGKSIAMWIFTAVFFTAVIYVIKAVRLYLILLEHRIAIKRYLKLYIKTTLVSLVLPLKTGELFKVYCYGTEMNSMKCSLLSVLVERYFDTIPLAILLIGFTFYSKVGSSLMVILLTAFLILTTVSYLIFPSSFHYINRFCIMNVNSERGLLLLDMMKKINSWYFDIQELIKGRGIILILLSGITWLMEYGILVCVSKGLGHIFRTDTFVIYINSIFVGSDNTYINLYVGISVVIFLFLTILVYGVSYKNGGK